MKGVILCGGLATRFLPISKSVPKEMLPILGRPAIDYIVSDFRQNGITDILVILGRNKECLENFYDRNIELESRLMESGKYSTLKELENLYTGVNITFARQIHAKGTGYAVSLCKEFVGNEPFIVSFPDEITIGQSFCKQLIDKYNQTKSSIIPLKQIPISESYKYGMIDYINVGDCIKVTNIIEKPASDESPSDICYTGGGLFTNDIFDGLDMCPEHENGEYYLTDAFFNLIKSDSLYGLIIVGERLDLGNPLGFIKSNIIAGLNDEKYSDELLAFMKSIVNDN